MSDDERRWREAMERLGVELVRAKVSPFTVGGAWATSVEGIVDYAPHPTCRFIETWLSEKDAAERKHRSRIDHWTLIFAAIGALTGLAGLALALILRG